MKLPAGLITALDAAINRYLRLDPDACERMANINARCIAIELTGIDVTLYALPVGPGIRITNHYDDVPDTILSGTPLSLVRLGLGKNPEKTLFSGNVTISGDVESGQAFQKILDEIDIDWEEQLSELTGDVAAHQLFRAARQAGSMLHKGRVLTEQNIKEYMQEELRVLPARIEIENFNADVTRLGMDTDRLNARIQRLRNSNTSN